MTKTQKAEMARTPRNTRRGSGNPPSPSPLQCEAYVNVFRETFDTRKAAVAAGYSEKWATEAGSRLLRDPRIVELLAERTLADRSVTSVRVGEVIQALREIAFLDPAQCFERTEHVAMGRRWVTIRLKDVTEMPLEVRRAIASIKVVRRNLVSGDGIADDMYEVKFWNKTEALDKLAQHLGMLTVKVEHLITDTRLSQMSDEELATTHLEAAEKWAKHVAARERLRASTAALPEAEAKESPA